MTTIALLLVFAVLLGFYLFLVVALSWLSDREQLPTARDILKRAAQRAQRIRRRGIQTPRPGIAVELGVVVLAAVVLTRGVLNLSPMQAPPGLAQAGALTPVQFGLDAPGRVPTWDPYTLGGAPVLSAPDNYLYNPFASLPVLIFGTVQGTKLAIFLAVLVAGLGQWSLAWAAGVGMTARLVAAVVFMSSGALGARFEAGAFQLGWSLAWVPWAMAGLWLALATDTRWPRGLAALALAWVFLSGNFFYTLPTLAMGTVVVLVHRDWEKARRALFIAVLSLLLAAVQLLPVLAIRDYIGPPDGFTPGRPRYGPDVALMNYMLNPVDWDRLAHAHPALSPGVDYAGVGWLPFLLIVIALVLSKRRRKRAWLAAGASLALMVLWGTGWLVPVEALYERVPLLAGFRLSSGDALAAGAVWLALLAALAFDELAQLWRVALWRVKGRRQQVLQVGIGTGLALLFLGELLTGSDDYHTRRYQSDIHAPLEAIRQQAIDEEGRVRLAYLSDGVDPHGPYEMDVFAKRPRHGWNPLPRTNALSTRLNLVPAHAITWEGDGYPAAHGYRQEGRFDVRGMPLILWTQRRPLEYAFVTSEARLDHRYLFTGEYTPGVLMKNEMDRLQIWVQVPYADEMENPILIVQETHFPGWKATIDGAPAEIYTVGAYMGIRIGGGVHVVELTYTPPLLGIGIALSLVGLLGLMGYIVRAPPRLRRLRAWGRLRRRRLMLVELALLIAIGVSFALPVLDFSPAVRPPGREHERLSGLLIPAEIGLREYGRIPLWNPYLFTGEPLVSNPFSYLFNPFASLPVLAFGALQGTKIAIALTVLIAGMNQWFFARVLGMGTAARISTAILYMCCGQIVGKFNGGHFQLGVSLAWPPLVLAGLWLTMTTRKRWPQVLTAAAFAMLFFAGNVYYTLHTLISAAVMAAFFAARCWRQVRGAAVAGLFALGLCAAQFLPVWTARDYIEHPGDPELVSQHPLDVTLAGYLVPYPKWSRLHDVYARDVYETVDYAYVGPLALVVLGLPVLAARRRDARFNWRAAWMGIVLFLLMFGWGTGLLPFINWLYAQVPLLAQFRFVGRVHAIATLWLAVVVGLVVDTLWRAVVQISQSAGYALGAAFGLPLLLVLGYGLLDVHRVNSRLLTTVPVEAGSFREAYEMVAEKRQIAEYVRTGTSQDAYAYNAYYAQIRHLNLTEGWRPRGLPSEVGTQWAIPVWERYAVILPDDFEAWNEIGGREAYLLERYGPVNVYEMPASLPYTFLVPRAVLSEAAPLRLEQVKPITAMKHEIDRVMVYAVGTQPGEVLVVLETNFPGWRVAVDGQRTELVNAGNYLGVETAVGAHTYTFWFRPPALDVGLFISGMTLAWMGLYLRTTPQAAESPAR